MPAITYPFDTTGLAPSNLVVDELHTLTEVNANTYRIFIPAFAPFYLDNFVLKHIDTLGNEIILIPDVQYTLCLLYEGATRSTGKQVYGGISIADSIINGTLKVTYQTIGGEWTADPNYVLNALAELVYNPRTTVWDVVTNKPNQFPPTVHNHHMDTIFGHEALIQSIDNLSDTIANTPPATDSLTQHLLDDQNPHFVSADQVGLGDVVNLPMATDQEVIDRLPLNKYITLRQLLLLLP